MYYSLQVVRRNKKMPKIEQDASSENKAQETVDGINLPFMNIRPGGNDTTLLIGIPQPKSRKIINDTIMSIYPNIEQVGFVSLTPGNVELTMAGGEFCGNATRRTAWLALNGQNRNLEIKVSGAGKKLKAGVTELGEGYAEMPVYADT